MVTPVPSLRPSWSLWDINRRKESLNSSHQFLPLSTGSTSHFLQTDLYWQLVNVYVCVYVLRELIYTNQQNTGAGLLCGSRNFISNPVTLIWRVHSLQSNFEKLVYLLEEITSPPLPRLLPLLSTWESTGKKQWISRANNLAKLTKRKLGFCWLARLNHNSF